MPHDPSVGDRQTSIKAGHDPALVEAVARGIDPTAWAPIQDDCPSEVREMRQKWQRQARGFATAALDAIEAAGCVVVPVKVRGQASANPEQAQKGIAG